MNISISGTHYYLDEATEAATMIMDILFITIAVITIIIAVREIVLTNREQRRLRQGKETK